MRRAAVHSASWHFFSMLDPDIALLQEVNSVPDDIKTKYTVLHRKAVGKTGREQKFGTAILAKGQIENEISLSSEWEWVNQQLDVFRGNFVAAQITSEFHPPINAISAYSPAWPIARTQYEGVDVTPFKLELSADVWGTELLWAALKRQDMASGLWVIAGDLNASETFDDLWGDGPRGNRELLQRFSDLNLTECLKHSKGMLTPTFKNGRGGKIIHQMDYLFVNQGLHKFFQDCDIGDAAQVFEQSLSDHLPIIATIGFPDTSQ